MRYSKQAILARFHKIPRLRFEDQQLTSFGGAIVFQALFQHLQLKTRLKACFPLAQGSCYGPHRIVLLLIVHCCWAYGGCPAYPLCAERWAA